MITASLQRWLPDIILLVKQTAAKILAIYNHPGSLGVRQKADGTLLTVADLIAHKNLVRGLQTLNPRYPILSEESVFIPFAQRQQWPCYWLIDPLDGTHGFISHNDQFCINIALIQHFQVVFGLIYVPISQHCVYAIKGQGAFAALANGTFLPLASTLPTKKRMTTVIVSPRNAKSALLTRIKNKANYHVIYYASAVKFIKVACGEANIYPGIGVTSEWDTAAGQCIVEEIGGRVINLQGKALEYNRKESLLNPEFIAVGASHYHQLDLDIC